ncbi:SRPBCC domain-containing protein [Flavobacterium wongokense]|uniref:SRPBCC domain-containing protein n=1 Tax=Flavobacterium wongokense TaxID=2910674 RepID=UPI001F358FCB|nr:SRPBCC domain-containing protein [Flavobacterium sp. WG47]MCF6133383.1 hypothetical protein [Flavobacterium sp. WG47]
MSKYILFFVMAVTTHSFSQSVKNTSYKNQAGERVLRFEMVIPLDIKNAWRLFSEDNQLQKWIAPVSHIELRTGGSIVTNYDSSKKLTDATSITMPIINFIENEMITLKVNLNGKFSKNTRDTDRNLQEIIQLRKIDDKHTKIISSMVGFGDGEDWDKTYSFFTKGNEWTYNELIRIFKK